MFMWCVKLNLYSNAENCGEKNNNENELETKTKRTFPPHQTKKFFTEMVYSWK